MLSRVQAVEFRRNTTSGRTQPALLLCERSDGSEVEVVAKFSASCDQGVINLAREAFAACLAGDLGLPIPEPVLIELPDGWADSIIDGRQRQRIATSSGIAFGSTFVGSQFSAWNAGTRLRDALVPVAAAVFTFDAIIQNPDRRSDNPNCLVRGDEIRIFDHELALSQGLMLGWLPPWQCGGLKVFQNAGFHIFKAALSRSTIDYQPIRNAWKGLADSMIEDYVRAIPTEWSAAKADMEQAKVLIKTSRDKIDDCLIEIQRVLA